MAGYLRFSGGIVGEVVSLSKKEMLAKYKDVPANYKCYSGWIELNSANQTVIRSIDSGRSGTARQRTGVVMEDIKISREMDKATPQIAAAVAAGQQIERVDIDLCMSLSGHDQKLPPIVVPYMEIVLLSVRITSYEFEAGGADTGEIPTETISLNFNRCTWTYHIYGTQPVGSHPDSITVKEALPDKYFGKITRGWDIPFCKPYTLD